MVSFTTFSFCAGHSVTSWLHAGSNNPRKTSSRAVVIDDTFIAIPISELRSWIYVNRLISESRPRSEVECPAENIVRTRFRESDGAVDDGRIAVQQIVDAAVDRILFVDAPRTEQVRQTISARSRSRRGRIADGIERAHRTDIVPPQAGAPVVAHVAHRRRGFPFRQ